jgi:Protein of unknown function (DUF3892)
MPTHLALGMQYQVTQVSPTNFLLREVTMPSRHEVHCINKSDRLNPHERIISIGGRNEDGTTWKLSQQDAVQGIEDGKWSFFVRRGGHVVNVIVSVSRYGYKYLKTEADGEHPDNLLALPECR